MRVQISNVAFLNRALSQVSADISKGTRKEINDIGRLVERDMEALTVARLRNVSQKPVAWSDMRVGESPSAVYVVPKRRGRVRSRKRPNFGGKVMAAAGQPAKVRNQAEINRREQALVARVVAAFNRGSARG